MQLLSRIAVYLICCTLTFVACGKKEVTPEPQAYELEVPANFPMPPSDPYNPLTKQGVALGRKLFFDPILSGNNKISCATCHMPEKAFSDGLALSTAGFSQTVLHRHSPALINMAWQNNGLFWDGGSTNLESQAFGPLAAKDELFQDLYQLIEELKAVPEYVAAFEASFKDSIKTVHVVRALAQFQRTLVSGNSSYDKFVRNEGVRLTETELEGLTLFQQKCQSCHQPPFFTDFDYHNNGLDSDFTNTADEGIYQGRYRITSQLEDLGKFKTPTLRNSFLTAPYMHDGRLPNLEAVLEHYATGIKDAPTTDRLLYQRLDGKPGIPINEQEKIQLMAFLKTLTDNEFISNPSFQSPFN